MFITKERFAIIENDTHIGKWVREAKRLDFDQNAIPTYLKYFSNNDCLLNIGANIGCYAYAFLDKASKIICFEPHDELFDCLKFNFAHDKNVTLYKDALYDKTVGYDLNKDVNNIGATQVRINESSGSQTKYIDQFNFSKIDFILMDCEGCECKILLGGEKTITKHKPIIVMEINEPCLTMHNSTPKDIFTLLDKWGYKYRNIYKEQEMSGNQYDIICIHKNSKHSLDN